MEINEFAENQLKEIDKILENALNTLDPVSFANLLDDTENLIAEYRQCD